MALTMLLSALWTVLAFVGGGCFGFLIGAGFVGREILREEERK